MLVFGRAQTFARASAARMRVGYGFRADTFESFRLAGSVDAPDIRVKFAEKGSGYQRGKCEATIGAPYRRMRFWLICLGGQLNADLK